MCPSEPAWCKLGRKIQLVYLGKELLCPSVHCDLSFVHTPLILGLGCAPILTKVKMAGGESLGRSEGEV